MNYLRTSRFDEFWWNTEGWFERTVETARGAGSIFRLWSFGEFCSGRQFGQRDNLWCYPAETHEQISEFISWTKGRSTLCDRILWMLFRFDTFATASQHGTMSIFKVQSSLIKVKDFVLKVIRTLETLCLIVLQPALEKHESLLWTGNVIRSAGSFKGHCFVIYTIFDNHPIPLYPT